MIWRVWHSFAPLSIVAFFTIVKIYNQSKYIFNKWLGKETMVWGEMLNRCFLEEYRQMANRNLKKCSLLLLIREMQIKIMRYFLTLVFKKSGTNSDSWNVELLVEFLASSASIEYYGYFSKYKNRAIVWFSDSTPWHP